jgi:CRP/FNR family transcriptional regulator
MALLKELGENELATLSARKSRVTYKKGQVLFYEGTEPMGLFCVHEGKVKVSQTSSNGREQIILISKKDDFLGYRALLSEERYGATATVIEEASICFIPKNDFVSVLTSNPIFLQKMLKEVCKTLGIIETKLTQFSRNSVRERLAGTILMLKETYGMEGEISESIDIILTREEIADIVGTSTETVIRLLSEFKSDGIVALNGKKIKVLDINRLAKAANLYLGSNQARFGYS